ncbi:hypothetical protein VE03_06274 [Pseudogymnoascus sp. 23342-1-I1]|nr:hypothetical protein VE03_06274 [Pseudogymnoascus sp. 23342-1-I1]
MSGFVPQGPPMGPPIPPNGFITLPAVPGYVPPELFTNFPPNALAFFSTNFGSRAARLIPNPAPQYAVRTNDPNDICERANYYREKYPEFVHSIQSLPITWEDLYTYFDPLDIWMEGAGFCFHVIHRLAAINIEKRRHMELFVDEWVGANLAKLARVPPNTPVTAVFEPEDYQYFDFINLRPFEVADVCIFLAQRCHALQPQLRLIREGPMMAVETDRHYFPPPVPTRSGPKTQHQIPSEESLNSDAIGLGASTTREFTGGYHVHRREASFENNRGMVRYPSRPLTKDESIYTYNLHRTSQSGPVALTGPIPTACTPPRVQDRALPDDNDQNRAVPGYKPGVNRNRAHSNVVRNQSFTVTRYEAASLIEVKTAIPDAQNPVGENCYIRNSMRAATDATIIEEGRSIYIRGFTNDEFASDLVPTMMGCCGEIEGYKPMDAFAFMTFKTDDSAAEAIRLFNGIHHGRPLKVAPYRRGHKFEYWNGPNRPRGSSFRGNQRNQNGNTGDPLETAEHGRTYKATGRDRNGSVSNNGAQIPRKEPNTPSKRHNTPSKHDLAIKKAHNESCSTPRGGKSHRSTNSGPSTKTAKSVDTGKLRQVISDSITTIPTKKGSFAVSEDLSVPEEGKYGTSFSSLSSSFTHKGSIFDESPADILAYQAIGGLESSSFGNKECSITSGAILASPERRDSNTATRESDKPGKKKKKKLKSADFNVVTTAGTSDCQTTCKTKGAAMDTEILKSDDLSEAKNDDAGPSSQLRLDPKKRDKASPTQSISNLTLTGMGEFGTRESLKKSTKVNHGSPGKLTTDEGSPMSSKKKHGKTDSNTSSFGIDTRAKKYEGYELTMNEATSSPGEVPHPEARDQMKTKFFKRNKSIIDLKENTHLERAPPATEVNILADPTHWPSLGEGKSSCRINQITADQTTAALLNPAPSGCLVTARRNSMAAIISKKTRIIPAVPLLLRSMTATEARSVSGDSGKSDETIIAVANTTGTRLWPAVVKWAGKPPSAEVVDNPAEAADRSSSP